MKKILIVLAVIVVIGLVIWKVTSSPFLPSPVDTGSTATGTDSVSVPSSQTVKVSDKQSEYKNDELGFSVKYPTTW